MRRHRICLRSNAAIALCACALALAACATPGASTGKPSLVAFPGTPTAQCAQEEVLPKIEEIRPATIKPGTEVSVVASGGYLRDNCGGFIEGSRVYKLYFDDEPIADLACYINHCEGKFTLPLSVSAGRHCMGVQKGSCQTEVDVQAQ